MEWTAPVVSRVEPPGAAGERETLEAWLDFHRATLLGKCSGLTMDQLRFRPVTPSQLSLLGLVRHMSEVERTWFQKRVAGRNLGFLYSEGRTKGGDFDDVGTADVVSDFAICEREVAESREVTHGRPLEQTFIHSGRGVELSLRWVYVHMIEEYARHNGHADLLRERLDGTTGY